jgi:L,D-peptidoglycan transpeptidase YkuD (ErfK/YbiS/YcfS/YnhG family)
MSVVSHVTVTTAGDAAAPHRGWLSGAGLRYPCSLGKTGIIAQEAKHEGDGHTPQGTFRLLTCWYRADRLPTPPITALPLRTITAQDGWCDDAAHPLYNQSVTLPFAAGHETLWREDSRYDLLVVLDYNLHPIVAGKGSAIFFHLVPEDYPPTQGCVGLILPHFLEVLQHVTPETMMVIE